ncbi:hypothetical protein FB548_3650 [Pseudoxanthomonas sp. 3HH-4]|uniref:hypothetical protein n=1 Tax=Pseudoxanthomonas sp. 3HH-4 TaxID=1690214 RepID=UPI001152EBE0|nr:hypothetical protein [Pseudoxanthomonas sp. 3HH-4]TQM03690.1 hypothetical protein FB548_3650 [Pseudoxanthomonas sp. 3HH-4]
MSGPKVVRIVTREEILAICEGHLQRLAQAFAHWQRQATRLGELDDASLTTTLERHDRLRKLLLEDQLAQLQAEVPLEIGFLERDLTQRQERAVAKASLARNAKRNLRENATTLLGALEHSASTDASLMEALRSIAQGRAMSDAAAVVAKGFSSLATAVNDTELSESQRHLARALQIERPDRWQSSQNEAREPRMQRIDEHLAQLQTLYGDSAAAPYLQRLEVIEAQSASSHRNMLLDSLVLDLAAATAGYQAQSTRIASLRTLVAELEALVGHEASGLLMQTEDCLASSQPDKQRVMTLSEQCREAIAQELGRRAAIARRRAVLDGLASLGYEVREGMETAWAQAGNVVLRKTATPGFGVEVGGRAESGRLQVRAVSLSGRHDRARDRDIETIWCGEFSRLRSLLATQGNELAIEKALGVGEVPLKVINLEADSGSSATHSVSRNST